MGSQSFKELSRQTYSPYGDSRPTETNVQTGCMQRIADAMEVMAKDRVKMEEDLKWYKDAYHRRNDDIQRLTASKNSLKGVITKLKKKIALLEGKEVF